MTRKARAPARIDHIPGWPDAGHHVTKHGGAVLNMAINLHAIATLGQHEWSSKYGKDLRGYNGLGASGAADAAFLFVRNPGYWKPRKMEAAREVWRRQNIPPEMAGRQDQLAALFGGGNHWIFHPGHPLEAKIERISIPKRKVNHLAERSILISTGQAHTSSDVHRKVFGPGNYRRNWRSICKMADLSYAMAENITKENEVIRLMRYGWELQMSLIESMETNRMRLIREELEGEFGEDIAGKATGAGMGGCFVVYAPKDYLHAAKRNIRHTIAGMDGAKILPFKVDYKGVDIWEE